MQAADPLSGVHSGATLAGRYRVLRPIGEGARGHVFLVEQIHLPGERLALKLVPGAGPERRERFAQEARALLRLVHPGIVTIRDVFEESGLLGFAMDHEPGPTLGAVLAREGPFAPERAVSRAMDLLDALHVAHRAGFVHRDLSPANVLVHAPCSPEERARIVDFGVAGLAGEALPAAGTPACMAPEQVRAAPCDGRTDLYALGCILFALLTGRPPFLAARREDLLRLHQEEPPPSLRAVAPRARHPEGLERILARALEKDRARRFESAAEMREALRLFADSRVPVPAAARGGSPGAPQPLRDVGDADVSSRGERVDGPARPGPISLPHRARLTLAPGLSPDGLRTIFVTAAPRLCMGRSRPEQTEAARENTLVLRVLPCRDEAQDPVHFRLTQGISASHATIEAREGRLAIVDHSRCGTWLDGKRLEKGRPKALPARFRLALFDALELAGRIHGEGAAVSLVRRGNLPQVGYLWVRDRVRLGPDEGAAVRISRGAGVIEREESEGAPGLRLELPAGVEAQPSEVGDETTADPPA